MVALARFKQAMMFLFGVIAVLLAVFFKGRSSGKAVVEEEEEVRQQEVKDVKAVAEKRVEEIKEVQNVQQDVVRSSDKSVDDELLNDWTRPDSGKRLLRVGATDLSGQGRNSSSDQRNQIANPHP